MMICWGLLYKHFGYSKDILVSSKFQMMVCWLVSREIAESESHISAES